MPKLRVSLQNTIPMRLAAEFDCSPGELIALVGPSGSGKTSLLRAVAGLLKTPGLAGTIRVGDHSWFDSGQRINLSPQQRRAGLVFQSYALFPHLSAIDNVTVGARARHSGDSGPINGAARALLARLGLGGLEQRRPAQLSGGQQQRVALARALMRVSASSGTALPQQPGVLLLDEPFSAVDAPTRQTLYRELAAVRQGVSIPMVLVTHDLDEARKLADRVVILDDGETLQSGTPAHVFASPRNARVAELMGIQNHFKGRFYKDQPGWGILLWGGDHAAGPARLSLRVLDKNKLDDGVDVSWVLAGEAVDVLPDASEPEAENTVRCVLQEMLALGETSLCVLMPEKLAGVALTLNISTALLRSMGARQGGCLRLHIAPQGVHIMPVRGNARSNAS